MQFYSNTMPFTIIHGLISYFAVCLFSRDKRLRLLAFAAGILPDLDALGILFGMDYYYQFHRTLFHPLLYAIVFAIPISFALNKFLKIPKIKSFIVIAVAFALHIATDLLFTSWPIRVFWPFSQQQFTFPYLEQFNSELAVVLLLLFAAQIGLGGMNKRKQNKLFD